MTDIGEARPRTANFARVHYPIIDDLAAKIGAAAITVYLVLARHCDRNGDCWPAVSRIAKLAGFGERATQRILRKLEKHGLVQIELRRNARGGCLSSRYRLPYLSPQSPGGPSDTPPVRSDTSLVAVATPGGWPWRHPNKNQENKNQKNKKTRRDETRRPCRFFLEEVRE